MRKLNCAHCGHKWSPLDPGDVKKSLEAANPKPVLRTIAEAANELEAFLFEFSGNTADWPIRLVCDEDASSELCDRLQSLRNALKPFREFKR